MTTQTLRRIAIVGGVRIPFCRSNTLYADLTNLEMMTTVLNGWPTSTSSPATHRRGGRRRRRHPLPRLQSRARGGDRLQARALDARHHPDPGLRHLAAGGDGHRRQDRHRRDRVRHRVRLGHHVRPADRGVEEARHRLRDVSHAEVVGAKLSVFKGFRRRSWRRCRRRSPSRAPGISMGQHCELMAQEWKITRAEQDQLAFESHQKAGAAYASGYMDDLIVPCAASIETTTCAPTSASRRWRR